jgi:hypothetical protein
MTRARAALGPAAALVAALFLAACAYFGPQALENNRNPYNIAIQSTNDEQLLLNLVRLKYRDTPFFLQVSSVATQFKFNPSLEVSGEPHRHLLAAAGQRVRGESLVPHPARHDPLAVSFRLEHRAVAARLRAAAEPG